MKKTFIISFLLIPLILISCKNEEKNTKKDGSEVEFVIKGTALNGNGKKLGLYIPSLGMDNRLTSEIIDGKFEFKGTLPIQERATISFDEELDEFDGMYSLYEVFLTNDTLFMDVEIDERDGNFYFSEKSFNDGGVNTFYYKNEDKFWNAFGRIMINPRDSVYMDSLRTNIFPTLRANIIAVNDSKYSDKENSIIGLFNLRTMFEERFVFDLSEMTNNEKKLITLFFNGIDKSLDKTPDYIIVNSHIKRMNDENYVKNFKDFTLLNINENKSKLSNILSKNEFTVLDFWHSSCLPCRKFNQESKEYYNVLKENGIEIVSINVDDGVKKWKLASKKDEIEWINLYAGASSKIQADYNVFAFPTKIIFDKNKQLIDFDFKNATELLKLK